MGTDIKTTGIEPGSVTGGTTSVEKAIEQLCMVVDHEIVPSIHTLCKQQGCHESNLNDPQNGLNNRVTALETQAEADEELNRERTGTNRWLIGLFIISIAVSLVTLVLSSTGG